VGNKLKLDDGRISVSSKNHNVRHKAAMALYSDLWLTKSDMIGKALSKLGIHERVQCALRVDVASLVRINRGGL